MTFDFRKLLSRTRHTRYKAIMEVNGKWILTCEVALVGGLPTQILFSTELAQGQLLVENDEEEIRSFAYALTKFAEMVNTALGNPPK